MAFKRPLRTFCSFPGVTSARRVRRAQTDAQTGAETEARTGAQTEVQTGAQTEVQTGAQTGAQTGGDTDGGHSHPP